MLDFLTAFHKQKATYWAKGASDGFGGYTFVAPVSLDVRWEEKNELVINDKGEQVVSHARVFVDRDLDMEGYLLLGASTTADPRTVDGTYRILEIRKTPGLDGVTFERKVFL